MTRLLFVTDPHSNTGLMKAAVELGNARSIHFLGIGGDFVDSKVAVPAGNGRNIPMNSLELLYFQVVEESLTEEEKRKLQSQGKGGLETYFQNLPPEKKEGIFKKFKELAHQYEIDPLKEILSGYNGTIFGTLGNHDPLFLKEGLEGIVQFLDDGDLTIGGLRVSGKPACYERTQLGALLPDQYKHLDDYVETTDEEIAKHPFENDSSVEPADIYMNHRPIFDDFCNGSSHDKEARKLVEIAKLRGKNPMILSGHFHGFKSGGLEQGVLQIVGGKDYVFEFDIDDSTKELNEVIIYKYVGSERNPVPLPQQQESAYAAAA